MLQKNSQKCASNIVGECGEGFCPLSHKARTMRSGFLRDGASSLWLNQSLLCGVRFLKKREKTMNSRLRSRCQRSRWCPGLLPPARPGTASCPSPRGRRRSWWGRLKSQKYSDYTSSIIKTLWFIICCEIFSFLHTHFIYEYGANNIVQIQLIWS